MASPQRLDRSRPYGTIHPPLDGMWFEQRGHLFDKDGFVQGYEGTRVAAPAAPKLPKPALEMAEPSGRITDSVPAEDDDALPAEWAGDQDNDTKFNPADATYDDGKGDVIDMIAWARGDKRYLFFRVKDAAKHLMPGCDNSSADSIQAAMRQYGLLKDK